MSTCDHKGRSLIAEFENDILTMKTYQASEGKCDQMGSIQLHKDELIEQACNLIVFATDLDPCDVSVKVENLVERMVKAAEERASEEGSE